MAYAKPTFNDLLLSMSYRYGETSVPSSGIDNRKYWINRGVEYCVEQLDIRKSVAVTVASGTCDLSVASAAPAGDFKSIVELRNSSDVLVPAVASNKYAITTTDVCCVTGSHGEGYTLLAKTDGDYTLWYRFFVSTMVATTDVCIISDPEAVAAYAYAQIRMSETDPLEDAQKNMDECKERIAAMAENMSRNEGDLTFKTLY